MEVPDTNHSEFTEALRKSSEVLGGPQAVLAHMLSQKIAKEQQQKAGQPLSTARFNVTAGPVSAHTATGANCAQQSVWIDDYRVPGDVGRAYEMCVEEYYCLHPRRPTQLVKLWYSERSRPESMDDKQCRQRALAFFSSLVFE